jgi:ABC-type nitrate/sulfonate/bicarbonate transport system permease component
MTRTLARFAHPGYVPVILLVLAWSLLPQMAGVPEYKLPRPQSVLLAAYELSVNGVLLNQTLASLGNLARGFFVGAIPGIVIGLAVGSSNRIASFLEAPLTFFQSIAGVAWIPLAIIWLGFGQAPVIFVVANGVFFIILLNTTLGVRMIPPVVRQAVRTLGGNDWDVLREVVIPGAVANLLTGLRLGLGFGWKALIAAELIAGGKGLGYMANEAGQRYEGATIIVAIATIGAIWLLMDRLLLRTLEVRTVERWGMVRKTSL